MSFKIISPISHDGVVYRAGDEEAFEKLELRPDRIARLRSLGVIAEVAPSKGGAKKAAAPAAPAPAPAAKAAKGDASKGEDK